MLPSSEHKRAATEQTSRLPERYPVRPVPNSIRNLDQVRWELGGAEATLRTNCGIQPEVVCGHLARETTDDADKQTKVCLEIIGPRNDHPVSIKQCQVEIRATKGDVETEAEEGTRRHEDPSIIRHLHDNTLARMPTRRRDRREFR